MNDAFNFQRLLPAWLTDLLNSPPAAGTGIHRWIYNCACKLAPWRTLEDAGTILAAATSRCGRPIPEREFTAALNNGYRAGRADWKPDGLSPGLRLMLPPPVAPPTTPRWPKPDWSEIARVAATGASLSDMKEESPLRLGGSLTAAEFLAALFPGDPLLCLAKAHFYDALTTTLGAWRDRSGGPGAHAFIVPSPMTAEKGRRKGDGKPSRRSLDNTGPRRFLVVEFDFNAGSDGKLTPAGQLLADLAAERHPRYAPDLCAALLLHLSAQGAPLLMAVHSGGKSLHGWFPVCGASDDDLRRFFAHACRLGADPATWSPCQFVRVPEGTRSGGRRQPVCYFDPACLAG